MCYRFMSAFVIDNRSRPRKSWKAKTCLPDSGVRNYDNDQFKTNVKCQELIHSQIDLGIGNKRTEPNILNRA